MLQSLPAPQSFSPITQQFFELVRYSPFVGILLWLVVIDVITGTFCAIVAKQLNSSISFRGMSRKAVMFLIIGVAAVIEPLAGMPLAKLVASFFALTEVKSILENAALLGVPLPRVLTDAMTRLQQQAPAATNGSVPAKIEGTLNITPVTPIPTPIPGHPEPDKPPKGTVNSG
jgi:toxin secretion/phage lysis holin